MIRTRTALASLAVLLGLLLAACGSDRSEPYDEHLFAAAVCVDPNGYRVPDTFCPIGDGIDNAGYTWAYREYRDDIPDIDIVYVGYPVDRTVYVHDRPARVRTTNIDRGRWPERPATVAAAGTSSARVVTIAQERRRSTVVRGGLGTPNARNGEAPKPNRTVDSKAPTRDTAKAAPKPLPKAPATRAVASPTKVKTGSR